MAQRPVYRPGEPGKLLVRTDLVPFGWHPGLAPSQKQKNIQALHEAARERLGIAHPLEISSKSLDRNGVAASAFNLMIQTPRQRRFSVECAFQASKVFESGGPYTDLLDGDSRQAKQDSRLKASGRLTAFRFFGTDWPLQPVTAFYDWLYLNALHQNRDLAAAILDHDAFTDIEFNPQKSLNCQAYSAALYVCLHRGGLIEAIRQPQSYLALIRNQPVQNASQDTQLQPDLF